MDVARKLLSILLLLPLISAPALADFKYTDTSQITGGALMGMANFAAKFSKDSRAAIQPITTTHYIKGNRFRTDGSDGTIQIIRPRRPADNIYRQSEKNVLRRHLRRNQSRDGKSPP